MKKSFYILWFLAFSNLNAQSNSIQKIDDILDSYKSNDSPGLSVKVIHQGKSVYSEGFGLSNLDYNIKNSDSTIFSLASIGKQFTASAIWALVNENKINLKDDIRDYLPEFPVYDEIIQIKHLLNHTSGIRNYHTLMYLSGFDYDLTYYDNNTVFELACRQKGLNNLPGEKVTYSNTNYNLLAIIIERITGQNLNDYLKSKILNALKMHTTFVRVEHGQRIKNKAVGYQKQNSDYIYNVTNQLSYGAGSMGSSINDMSIWMQMLNEEIAQFKSLAQFLKTTEVLTTGKKAKYARGVSIDNYKGFNLVSHGGFGFGGRTQLITVPDLKLGIIVMSNLQSINSPRIAYQILDVLLPKKDKDTKDEETTGIFKRQDFNLFTGEYKEIHSDMTMKIFIESDTLKSIGSIGKTAASLTQIAENEFHRDSSQNVKYNFSLADTHDMSISFGGTPFYFERAKFVDVKSVNVFDFIGKYFSEELGAEYHFFVEDNTLKLSYHGNDDIILKPVQLNEFGNSNRTLYHFTKDKRGETIGMLLSCDGTVKNIIFKKKAITN